MDAYLLVPSDKQRRKQEELDWMLTEVEVRGEGKYQKFASVMELWITYVKGYLARHITMNGNCTSYCVSVTKTVALNILLGRSVSVTKTAAINILL